jgi:hypothetical protein
MNIKSLGAFWWQEKLWQRVNKMRNFGVLSTIWLGIFGIPHLTKGILTSFQMALLVGVSVGVGLYLAEKYVPR